MLRMFARYATDSEYIGRLEDFVAYAAAGKRLLSPASRITTPVLSRKRMRQEQVDYQDISGRLARMLGR